MINRSASVFLIEHEVWTGTLVNANGLEAKLTNYGATLMSLKVPDRHGEIKNVVLGFDEVSSYRTSSYLRENPYLGTTVGRHANVISNSSFNLSGKEYLLNENFGNHNLHGGIEGFDKKLWNIDEYSPAPNATVRFSYNSPDKEEGFPGNVQITLQYELTDNNELKIVYTAIADQKTIVNLTNHSYFNLGGEGNGDILGHELMIDADKYVEFTNELVPTGAIKETLSTPMDFRAPSPIGSRIGQPFDQLQYGQGYDVTYALNHPGNISVAAATLYDNSSGIFMALHTTMPGLQLYSGNSLNGQVKPSYKSRSGVCLETQYFPDAIHFPHFPGGLVDAGEIMTHTTIYTFSIR